MDVRPTVAPLDAPSPATSASRLSLIEQLAREAVASDYPPSDTRVRQATWATSLRGGLALALVGVGLGSALMVSQSSSEDIKGQRSALLEQVHSAEERVAAASGKVRDLDAAVTEAQQRAVGSALAQIASDVDTLELMTGYSAVRGPGVVFTLSDGTSPSSATGEVESVYDVDLQVLVNGLWRAGAEAIDINGQRLSARTAIRSAGSAITVNYRPLRPPYSVSAIGDADGIMKNFNAGHTRAEIQKLQDSYGLGFEQQKVDTLTLPPATSRFPDKAKVVQAPLTIASSPAPSPTSTPVPTARSVP